MKEKAEYEGSIVVSSQELIWTEDEERVQKHVQRRELHLYSRPAAEPEAEAEAANSGGNDSAAGDGGESRWDDPTQNVVREQLRHSTECQKRAESVSTLLSGWERRHVSIIVQKL